MKHKLESRLPEEISITSYADDTTLMAESEEELKYLLMKVKEESEKVGLKFNIQITKIMASGPITSCQIDGETVESDRLYFLGLQITADGDCSHGIKRRLLLERKAINNPRQCIKKQRHYFANKGLYSQSYGFSSSTYKCERWTRRRRLSTKELMVSNYSAGEDS